jgi:hypothetical protein
MLIRPIALAAAMLLATPASAQQATPQENLDCAVWAAVKIGVAQDDKANYALSIALGWFIGQYEGRTGEVVGTPLALRAMELDGAAVDRLTDTCLGRFRAFGDRLTNLNQQLLKSAE